MPKTCLKCGHVTELDPAPDKCPQCGAIYAAVEALIAQGRTVHRIVTPETLAADRERAQQNRERLRIEEAERLSRQVSHAWTTGDWSAVPKSIMEAEFQKVVATTTDSLPGESIERLLGIVSAESVIGVNVLDDYLLSWTDILGGRSKTAQSLVQDARKGALDALKANAFGLGADAVIAVRFEHSEITGKNKSMLMVTATGTAVKSRRSLH